MQHHGVGGAALGETPFAGDAVGAQPFAEPGFYPAGGLLRLAACLVDQHGEAGRIAIQHRVIEDRVDHVQRGQMRRVLAGKPGRHVEPHG